MRCTGFFRVLLVGSIFLLAWYTVHLYAQLYTRLSSDETPSKLDVKDKDKSDEPAKLDDPDNLIEADKIRKEEEIWDKQQANLNPSIKRMQKNPCAISTICQAKEVSFKILTGAANVIGPSVCLNDSILMKNSLNNVDRGMNIAVIDGKSGKSIKQLVFDLYGKDSSELKAFLKDLGRDHFIMVTTYDDAAFKLDDDAKEILANLGSSHSKQLAFRDNWVFVGGHQIEKPSKFEQLVKNEKEKNKYGDWPEAIVLEGCLPLLQ